MGFFARSAFSFLNSFKKQDEVSLYDNARERRQWDKLSEFFAIIKTTEHLENARIKSAIGRDEVRHVCSPCPMFASHVRVFHVPVFVSVSHVDIDFVARYLGANCVKGRKVDSIPPQDEEVVGSCEASGRCVQQIHRRLLYCDFLVGCSFRAG